jgi:FkbM family methyltransferase
MKLLSVAHHLLHRAGIDIIGWPHRPEKGAVDWGLAQVLQSRGINCVIDVGGNHGRFALRLRELGYSGRIVSFEPSPAALPVIQAAAERDPEWTVRPVGLSSRPGQAEMRLHEWSELDSMLDALPGVVDQIPLMAETGSATITLSTLAAELPSVIAGLAEPRMLLKSDTQGWDAEVLRGAGNDGLPPFVLAVLVELAAQPMYDGQPSMTSVMDLIMADGLSPVAFEPWFPSPDGLRMVEMDALFMRPAENSPDWGQPRSSTRRQVASGTAA